VTACAASTEDGAEEVPDLPRYAIADGRLVRQWYQRESGELLSRVVD
jgi:hypothetical protein